MIRLGGSVVRGLRQARTRCKKPGKVAKSSRKRLDEYAELLDDRILRADQEKFGYPVSEAFVGFELQPPPLENSELSRR
jgi:hypothetical protein